MVRLITCVSGVVVEAVLSFETCCSAAPRSTEKSPVGSSDGKTATSLSGGNCVRSQRAVSSAACNRVRFSSRYSIRGEVSKIRAAATGASWLPRGPAALMLGRANAAANSTIAAQRRNNNRRCRSRSCRRLACSRCWRNRIAGKISFFGTCFITKCKMIGTAINAAPARMSGDKNVKPICGND